MTPPLKEGMPSGVSDSAPKSEETLRRRHSRTLTPEQRSILERSTPVGPDARAPITQWEPVEGPCASQTGPGAGLTQSRALLRQKGVPSLVSQDDKREWSPVPEPVIKVRVLGCDEVRYAPIEPQHLELVARWE